MQIQAIRKIYTNTKGFYTLVEFANGMMAAIGNLERVQQKNRWGKDLENIAEEESMRDKTSPRGETYQDLDPKGQLITNITKSLNGIFKIRIDGQEIEVSPAELKALLIA